MANEPETEDAARFPVFIACTRPAMKMGVPVEGLLINGFASYIALLWIGDMNPLKISFWLCFILSLMINYSMRWMVGIDHNMFRIVYLFFQTRGIQLRGVSVLWAMPWRRPKDSSGVFAVA